MDRHLVVSSDCHAGLLPDRYREYFDPQYRDAFDVALPIQIERTKEAAKKFLVDEANEAWRGGLSDVALSGAWDHDQRVKVMDGDGIAAEVIFPDGITEMNMPPFGAGLSLPVDEVVPELQWVGARAHNRWLAEFCQMDPDRRAGVAIVPALWDVDEAVREVAWARENGLRSVLLPCHWGTQPSYQDPRYDPLWAACQDHDLVVNFHSGGAPMADYGDGPGMVGIYISEVAWWTARPLAFLVWSGVFERHPRLKVAITEGTCIWAPELKTLLDFRYEETHFAAKLGDYRSHLSMKPSEYFDRNVFYGASCMPRREAETREAIGVANIMWGSDYPHPEGTWPETEAQMHEAFDGLPEADVEAMLGRNAARVYGLDVEKLETIAARIGPEKASFAARKGDD